MWFYPRLKLNNELTERGGFFCDRENPFARFGGGGSDVQQAPTHTEPWGELEQALAGLVVPGIEGMGLTQPTYYQGERYAPMGETYTGAAEQSLQNLLNPESNQALQNLMGSSQDVFDPVIQAATNQWNQQIAPGVMERFAGMGNAMSGGAASALAREGENLSTDVAAQLAPLYLQSQTDAARMIQEAQQTGGLMASELGSWEQANRQGSLDTEYQQWFEQQPYGSPYVALGRDILSGGGASAMENYAEPGTDWGQVGGNVAGSAIMAAALKSDKRLKENLEPIRDALDKIKTLTPFTFNFKAETTRRASVMAQDLQAVLPEAVEQKEGVLYIRLDGVIGLLVGAVNELAGKLIRR